MKRLFMGNTHSYRLFLLADKWMACQSMDNQIMVFGVLNRFRQNRKKTFKGHMVRKKKSPFFSRFYILRVPCRCFKGLHSTDHVISLAKRVEGLTESCLVLEPYLLLDYS